MTRRQTLALVALSLWSGTSWLTDQFLPSFTSPLAGQGFRLLLLGACSLALALAWPTPSPKPSKSTYARIAAASLGLIALPFVLLDLSRGRIASTTGVLIFALLPVIFAILPGGSGDRSGTPTHLLPYAMAALAGILILLPIPLPSGVSGTLGLAATIAAMLLTAASTIWLHRLLGGGPLRIVLPAVCLLNGLLLTIAAGLSALHGPSALQSLDRPTLVAESLRALAIDLPQTLLLLWLLTSITPLRLSSRYLIAPLITVLEGLVLFRPHADARTILGIVLLGVGAWFIAQSPERKEEVVLKLD